jgi:ribonucleoside-diphosphate reductase subunit M2
VTNGVSQSCLVAAMAPPPPPPPPPAAAAAAVLARRGQRQEEKEEEVDGASPPLPEQQSWQQPAAAGAGAGGMEAGDRLVQSAKQQGRQQESEEEWVEPICREDPSRFVLFPMRHPDLWEMYKRHEASFWTAEEVDLSQDMEDWRVRTVFVYRQHVFRSVRPSGYTVTKNRRS